MNNARFKFRVWDKIEKSYVDYLLLGVDGLLYESADGKAVSVDQARYEREQCTGQHDRNENLIYEGDIVATDNAELVVEWYRAGWWGHNRLWCSLAPLAGLVVEVIGNIHEVKQ